VNGRRRLNFSKYCTHCIALILSGQWLFACSEPCESGEARCNGKSVETCGRACEDCDIGWLAPMPCAGACIAESEDSAFCSLTENADPQCSDRIGYCADDLQVHCRSGYPVSRDRCELPPGLPGKAMCVETPAGLACKATGAPPGDGGT